MSAHGTLFSRYRPWDRVHWRATRLAPGALRGQYFGFAGVGDVGGRLGSERGGDAGGEQGGDETVHDSADAEGQGPGVAPLQHRGDETVVALR